MFRKQANNQSDERTYENESAVVRHEKVVRTTHRRLRVEHCLLESHDFAFDPSAITQVAKTQTMSEWDTKQHDALRSTWCSVRGRIVETVRCTCRCARWGTHRSIGVAGVVDRCWRAFPSLPYARQPMMQALR